VVRDHQINPTTRNEEPNVGGIQNLFPEILGIQAESSTEKSMTSSTDFSRGSTGKKFEDNGMNKINIGPKVYANVMINGKMFKGLIDSGANVSAMDSNLVAELGTALHKRTGVSGLVTQMAVSGEGHKIKEMVEVAVEVEGKHSMWTFCVIDGLATSLILGSDWMNATGVILDVRKGTLTFSGAMQEPVTSMKEVVPVRDMKMRTANRICIPAESAIRITVEGDMKVNEPVVLAPRRELQFTKDVYTPYVFAELSRGMTDIWVTNLSGKSVKVPKGTVVCNASGIGMSVNELVIKTVDAYLHSETECDKNFIGFKVSIGSQLTGEEQKEILRLIEKFRDVFSEKEVGMGKTSLVKHNIIVEESQPIHCAPYRTSFAERKEIRKRVDELQQAGVVVESNSPWSAPVVLIPKRDGGGFRFCVDYRKLNAITKKDVYPLPRIEDALDNLGGSSYFTTLDLTSGFYQIEVDDRDQEKTAFITPDGLYEFKRMPMGLCNSPATFQRLMDRIFRTMKWTALLVYLDDLIVFGKSFQEMLGRIEIVLSKLREAGLTLKPSKCRFGEESLKYLGHIISREGIAVNPEKVESIVKFPQPKNLTELRGFINLCGYYRRFVNGFSRIAQPLNFLLKKDSPFIWGSGQQEAFEKLKFCLVNPPILAFPMENLPTVIHTDACGYGLGAVICQLHEGKERVVAYASRSMIEAEKKYTASEQECLAIVFAVAKFRPYIWGRRFTVVTDHNALRWLFNIKDPNGRLARWSLQLQSYDMEIIHRPGKIHADADALSRFPANEPDTAEQYDIWAITVFNDVDNVALLQKEDPYWSKFVRALENLDKSEDPEMSKISLEDYSLQNGILYKANYNQNGRDWRMCVPKKLRAKVIDKIHSDPTGGHLGSTRTYFLLSQRYYWKGMYRDIRRFIRCCKVCDLFKPKQGKFGKMQSFEDVTKPFQRLGMDFVGPLKTTVRGNKYILVMIDHFSRYLEASALPSATVDNVITQLHEKVLYRHSCPLEVVVDRGSQFMSALMKTHSENSRYKLRFTAPYHPQSNGITERVNKTVKTMLKKFVSPDQKDWDDFLPAVVFAYNITRHESTLFTPFYLMFGREARIPADMEFPVLSSIEVEDSEVKANQRIAMQSQAAINSKKAHEANRKRYDRVRGDQILHKGDWVWRLMPVRKKGLTHAFIPQKKGPFEVIEQTSPVNFRIKLVRGKSKAIIVHVNDLCKVASEFESSSDETVSEAEVGSQVRGRRRKVSCEPSRRKICSSSSETDSIGRVTQSHKSSSKSSGNRQSAKDSHKQNGMQLVDATVDDTESEAAVVDPVPRATEGESSRSQTRPQSGANTSATATHVEQSTETGARRSTRARKRAIRLIEEID